MYYVFVVVLLEMQGFVLWLLYPSSASIQTSHIPREFIHWRIFSFLWIISHLLNDQRIEVYHKEDNLDQVLLSVQLLYLP